MKNKIITHGFSATGRHLIITRGYVPTLTEQIIQGTKEFFRSIVRGRPRRHRRREEEEFYIKVALIAVNNHELRQPIVGRIKAVLEPNDSLFIKVVNKIRVGTLDLIKDIFVKARLKWKR